MRKVVTGEQVAQMVNPDPFALPIWRAPVYRTPAIFTLAVQLYRLLSWLVRFVARHPVAVTVLALLALTWLDTGWVGLAALTAWTLAVLGTWRSFWPVSFARWVLSPIRNAWRAWAVPPPLGWSDDDRRGCSLVPGPGPGAGAGQGHLDAVCRPGDGPAGFRPVRG
jgi:hypothetical protein